MSGPPAKIVCQVSGVARLPTGRLMKGFAGESGRGGGGGGVGERRGGVRGGVGLPSAAAAASIAGLYRASC